MLSACKVIWSISQRQRFRSDRRMAGLARSYSIQRNASCMNYWSKQRAKTGRVRAVVLKARQLGVSTYVAARKFHRTINNPGLRTIIIGHERRASSNLFQIVKRFYENMPESAAFDRDQQRRGTDI